MKTTSTNEAGANYGGRLAFFNRPEGGLLSSPSAQKRAHAASSPPARARSLSLPPKLMQAQPVLGQALSQIGFKTPESQQAFANLLRITHGPSIDLSGSVSQMKPVNEFMQEKFLRKKGTERQQHSSHPLDSHQNEILPLLKKMGFHSRVEPEAQKYDAVVLLGAAQPTLEARLAYAHSLTEKYELGPLYLLGGQRDLWPVYESITSKLVASRIGLSHDEVEKQFFKLCPREILASNDAEQVMQKSREIIRIFMTQYPQLNGRWPTELDMMIEIASKIWPNQEIIPIDTPKKANGSRPNTEDTFIAFKQHLLEHHASTLNKRILSISSQPHCIYQNNIGCSVLESSSLSVKTVAPAISNQVLLSEQLDALARTFYVGRDLVNAHSKNKVQSDPLINGGRSRGSLTDKTVASVDYRLKMSQFK